MTTFKIGDRVRVLGTPEAKEATREVWAWAQGMDQTVGQVGVVYSISDFECHKVEFSAPINDSWAYAPESLELVEDEAAAHQKTAARIAELEAERDALRAELTAMQVQKEPE